MLNFSVRKFSNKIQFPNTAILLLMEIMIHCMITESRFTLKVMFMYLFNILLRGLFEVMLKGTSELVEQSDLLTVLQKACGCRCLVYKEHKQLLDSLMISDQSLQDFSVLRWNHMTCPAKKIWGNFLRISQCLLVNLCHRKIMKCWRDWLRERWKLFDILTSDDDTVTACWTKPEGHLMLMLMDCQMVFICKSLWR